MTQQNDGVPVVLGDPATSTGHGGSVWITRMATAKREGPTVAEIGYRGDGARRTFDHARRVFAATGVRQGADLLRRGDLVVTLLDANGDLTDDEPLRVPAAQADWFLNEWLAVPKAWQRRAAPTTTEGRDDEA